ncbi:uncharacterized protein LOC129912106 isoform X2 [Episyrphus balteatus]|nr:uncharacterized protein LOC129912106 isoform X2 [Episyrphus balteatus]
MKERHIDQIFLEFPDFNTKMIFESKLGIWQNENGVFTVSPRPVNKLTNQHSVESWVNTLSSPSPTSSSSDSDVTVLEILKKTEQGRAILESYRLKNCLTPEDRTNLVHKIVQYFTENKKKMTVKRCEILAEEIVKIFPTENLGSYFVRGFNKIPPKGKLYDRYRGQRRSLKQLYKTDPTSSKKVKLAEVEDNSKEDCDEEPINETEMQRVCDELKQNRDWETVTKQWKQTMPFRRDMISQSSDIDLHTVLQEWPLYKYSRAPELIAMDYNFIKPNNGFDFTKWEQFSKIALELFTARIKCSALKSFLNEFRENIDDLDIDNVNIGYATLLHGVLPPSSQQFNGKLKKFTIEDSKSSFTLEVECAGQVEPMLKIKREECLKSKTKLQPLIIVVGERFHYNNFYVSLDNIMFKLDTYLDCIIFYLKLVYVLNIQYPPQCFSVWVFIQMFFFNIQDGKKIPSVSTLLNDINALIN